MTKKKNFYCASAAILLTTAAATEAGAADPIIVAEPVNYVRICDAFGAGFFYIPGSNTCLKISGYARAEASWVQEGNETPDEYFTTVTADYSQLTPPPPVGLPQINNFIDSIEIGVTKNPDDPDILASPLGASATIGGMQVGGVNVDSDAFDNFTTRARGEVQFDARTETDMGILRSYVALRGTIGHNDTSDDFSIDKAFLTLQNDFGTFTAGHILSFFDFFGGYSLNSRVGGDDPTNTTNLFGYTFNAGNGFSASVSVEDRRQRQNDLALYPVWNQPSSLLSILQQSTPFVVVPPGPGVPPNPPGCPGGAAGFGGCIDQLTGSVSFLAGAEYEGQEIPDFVANIRVDQGWGSAQIMGGLRQVNTSYGGDAAIRASDITRVTSGFGLPSGGGASEDLADLLNFFVPGYPSYSNNELGWVVGAGLTADIPGTGIEASIQGAYTEGMVGYVTTGNGAVLSDALTVGTYSIDTNAITYDTDLTKAWSIIAGIKADLTQSIEVRLNGTYADVDHAGSYFDYDTWTAAGTVLWRPVEGLSIGGEISYERIDGDVYAAGDAFAGILPTPVGIGDGDLWGALFRVTRSF